MGQKQQAVKDSFNNLAPIKRLLISDWNHVVGVQEGFSEPKGSPLVNFKLRQVRKYVDGPKPEGKTKAG